MPTAIPPLGDIDQFTTDLVISPGQTGLPGPQRVPSIISFPSTVQEDGERPPGAPDHYVPSTSHSSGLVNVGSEDSLHARQEQSEAGFQPLNPPPRDRDEASTVDPIRSTTQDPTHKRAGDPEPDEALHDQLADLADMIRQLLALYGEKKFLVEPQWAERLRWTEGRGAQMLKLMAMASLLVDKAVSARQEERQANEDNPSRSNQKSQR